jgi:putative CocE/NonD family hydrolase
MRVLVDRAVPVVMRDGVTLAADVYRPDVDEPVPVLLTRNAYDRTQPIWLSGYVNPFSAAEAGYAVVHQDVRGRHGSEGEFQPFRNEALDGYDSVEWCAAQDWAAGPVGMFGSSYFAVAQWMAAALRPPHLRAIAPMVSSPYLHRDWIYPGGAFSLGFMLSWCGVQLGLADWLRAAPTSSAGGKSYASIIGEMPALMRHLPLDSMPPLREHGVAGYFFEWLEHADLGDSYWDGLRGPDTVEQVDVPVLSIGGWYDIFVRGTVEAHEAMIRRGVRGSRLVMGPWYHTTLKTGLVGEVDFGVAAAIDMTKLHLDFFDAWVREGEPRTDEASPSRIFLMGRNAWRDDAHWPPSEVRPTRYYLRSQGQANVSEQDGRLTPEAPGAEDRPDHFVYDPTNPVPTRGGGLCCDFVTLPAGAFDQRALEARADVAVYTSEPLPDHLEVTGSCAVTLWAATSAADTDWTAKLVDVEPCGFARNVADGIVRARYGGGMDGGQLVPPDTPRPFRIELGPTSNVFLAGHRIRLEVSSSNFPRFDRNLNSGGDPATDGEPIAAFQTVLHGPGHESYIELPTSVARIDASPSFV